MVECHFSGRTQFISGKVPSVELHVLNHKRAPCTVDPKPKYQVYRDSISTRLCAAGEDHDPAAVDWYMLTGEPKLPGDDYYGESDSDIEQDEAQISGKQRLLGTMRIADYPWPDSGAEQPTSSPGPHSCGTLVSLPQRHASSPPVSSSTQLHDTQQPGPPGLNAHKKTLGPQPWQCYAYLKVCTHAS